MLLKQFALALVSLGAVACDRAAVADNPPAPAATTAAPATQESAPPRQAIGAAKQEAAALPTQTAALPTQAAAPAKGGDACQILCSHARSLRCREAAACPERCAGMQSASTCQRELAATFGCFAKEPVAHWECDEEGNVAIREGYCDAEQGAFAACLGAVGVQP